MPSPETDPVTFPNIHNTPRPVIQRRELGPIVHAWGGLVIEALSGEDAIPFDYTPITVGYPDLIAAAVRLLDRTTRDAVTQVVNDNREAAKEVNWFLQMYGSREQRLTYAGNIESLLREGIRSGLWIPFNAYTIATAREPRAISYKPTRDEVALQDYSMTLRRDDFRTCMVKAGQAANGFWGALSSGPVADSFHDVNVGMALTPLFDREAFRGGVYTTSDKFDKNLRESLSTANRLIGTFRDVARHSGGCPVRHQGFPEATVGDFARDYLTGHGFALPPEHGPSLIEDIMTLQADMLDRIEVGCI